MQERMAVHRRSLSAKGLLRWLFYLVFLAFLALVLLYGVAQLWMLNDDASIEVSLAETGQGGDSTIDLVWPGVHYSFQTCCDESTAIIDDVAGRPARSFTIRPDDPLVKGSHRSEIRFRPNALGQEAWYRGELFVPEDWRPSPVRVTIMQWHGTRDVFLFERGRTPPLQLEIIDNRWEVVKSWDERFLTPVDAPAGRGRETIASAPIKRGQWVEWTFQVDWTTDEAGVVRAWLDGDLLVEDRGPNAHKDLIGPYMKAGVYVPDWTIDGAESEIPYRKIFISKLMLGDSASSFED